MSFLLLANEKAAVAEIFAGWHVERVWLKSQMFLSVIVKRDDTVCETIAIPLRRPCLNLLRFTNVDMPLSETLFQQDAPPTECVEVETYIYVPKDSKTNLCLAALDRIPSMRECETLIGLTLISRVGSVKTTSICLLDLRFWSGDHPSTFHQTGTTVT
uniref:Uncharacterized protein n=1 Tax=Romanomermis culicivorax TaxID=13658 RepID=A0A915J0U1_ROMCU